MIERYFLEHPRQVGESYGEHQQVALAYAGQLFVAALACLAHAVVPGLFERTASRIIRRLHLSMQHRSGGPAPVAPNSAEFSIR